MKKTFALCLIIFSALIFTGCSSRVASSLWEDTKTAGRYFGRGVKALGGGGRESRLIHYPYEFTGPEELEYVAMHDEEEDGLSKRSYPLSHESPGELGSFLPGIEGFHDPAGKEAEIFRQVHFDTNKDQVKSSDDEKIVKSIAKYLKKNPREYVFILGHCDQRGTALYNMSLGSRRSNSIRNMLIEQGVDLNRVFTISYGKEKPQDPANTSAAWEKNRRVEFKVYKKK